MDQPTTYCSRCGAEVSPAQQFCPNCGQRLSENAPMYPPPTEKVDMANYPAEPVPPLPEETYPGRLNDAAYDAPVEAPRKRNPLPFVLGGVLMLCLCGVIGFFGITFVTAGGIAGLAMLNPNTETPTATVPLPATDTPVPADTAAPSITEAPTLMAATEAALPPTGPTQATAGPEDLPTQAATGKWSDNPFSDDFSTDRSWPLVDDASQPDYSVSWIGDVYQMAVTKPSTQVWVFPPTDYTPDMVEFDAIIPNNYTGSLGGTFGVLCHFVDSDNYHEIELDAVNNSYAIARVVNDERQKLTAEDWMDFNFNQGAGAVNHVVVRCQGNTLALEVNGQAVISIEDPNAPFIGETRTALTISTYKEIDPGGYVMWFDNFTGSMQTP